MTLVLPIGKSHLIIEHLFDLIGSACYNPTVIYESRMGRRIISVRTVQYIQFFKHTSSKAAEKGLDSFESPGSAPVRQINIIGAFQSVFSNCFIQLRTELPVRNRAECIVDAELTVNPEELSGTGGGFGSNTKYPEEFRNASTLLVFC